ncbi:MAG: hypothetical protein HGA90_01650 [Alphaproteobacteria bacterium]|nr:hypothetical protein [Alphaproteobacteria bacterium]
MFEKQDLKRTFPRSEVALAQAKKSAGGNPAPVLMMISRKLRSLRVHLGTAFCVFCKTCGAGTPIKIMEGIGGADKLIP